MRFPFSHLEVVHVSWSKNSPNLEECVLTSEYFCLSECHHKNISNFSIHPALKILRLFWKELINLFINFFPKILKNAKDEFTSKRESYRFPMRNLRIIILFLKYLNLSESPPIYFLDWRVKFDNNVRMINFIEKERRDRILLHLFVCDSMALGELTQFPKIFLEALIRCHFKKYIV